MAKQAVLEVNMDDTLMKQGEELYSRMGTSLQEAVRVFVQQSVAENAMPFVMHLTNEKKNRTLGIADGEYNIPEDIDFCNDEIAAMFGVNQ